MANTSQIVRVRMGTTTIISKGSLKIGGSAVVKGDKILSATGIYDRTSGVLDAKEISVYLNPAPFKPQNFEGVLKQIVSENPFVFVATVGGVDMTVYTTSEVTILTKARKPASVRRFVLNDTVRFYGARRESNQSFVDASVIRNLDL